MSSRVRFLCCVDVLIAKFQRHPCCGPRDLTTAVSWFPGPHDGRVLGSGTSRRAIFDVFGFRNWTAALFRLISHKSNENVNMFMYVQCICMCSCVRFLCFVDALIATFQRHPCCGPRDLTTAVSWVPGSHDGRVFGFRDLTTCHFCCCWFSGGRFWCFCVQLAA